MVTSPIGQLCHWLKEGVGLVLGHPILAISIIALMPDGNVVLVKRKDNGLWSLPGGMVNWGEEILVAARRELKEETGLQFIKLERLVGIYSSPHRDPRFHSVCIAVAAKVDGTMGIQDSLEISHIEAYSWKDIPLGYLSHDHDRQIHDYLQGVTTLA